MILVSLSIGGIGYHYLGNLDWLSAFLNASMILTGMGPVDPMISSGGKLFAIFYSLFSGVTFLIIAGIIFAPLYQRFLHKFHLDIYGTDEESFDNKLWFNYKKNNNNRLNILRAKKKQISLYGTTSTTSTLNF